MKRATVVQLVIFLGFFLVYFIALLWGSKGVSPELARLERILAVLQKNPRYFWQVRPNLNTEFEGGKVATDENGFRLLAPGSPDPIPEKPFRVFVFGASPTFGYGIEADQTYSKVAEKTIQSTFPNVSFKNIGQIGYSSYQGRRLFTDVIAKDRPDMATVSYMVNDIDRLRFFLSNGKDDLQTKMPSPFQASFYNWAYSFSPTKWLLQNQRRLLVKIFGGLSRRGSFELSHVRVKPEDYKKHLEQFVADCRANQIPLLFIKMPFRLPDPIPPAPEGTEKELSEIEELIDAERYQEASGLIDDAIAKDPFCSKALYLRGRVQEAEGKKEKAHTTYAQSVKFLIYDCQRDANRYNDIMESVAVSSHTPLVDAAAGLGSDRADMNLFVPNDYIHPNAAGNKIIGECLSSAVSKYRSNPDEMFIERCGVTD